MTINYHSNTIRILFVRNRDSKNCYNIIFHWSWEKAKVDHVRQNRCVDWASLTWRNKIYSNFNKVTLEMRRINALLTDLDDAKYWAFLIKWLWRLEANMGSLIHYIWSGHQLQLQTMTSFLLTYINISFKLYIEKGSVNDV
jgi:hypothetical protein